jgi:uncharacterized protein (TIGR03435 family)
MRSAAFVLSGILACAMSIRAQSPGAPAFEVASVKPNKSGASNSSTSGNATSFTAVNVSLRQLIVFAYRLKDFQVGAPSWTESERYDIAARSPEGGQGDNRQRLQTLLADRFTLKVHRETREQPVYALILARSDGRLGPQLKPSTIDCKAAAMAKDGGLSCGMNTSSGGAAGRISAIGQSMEALADALGNYGLSRMVIDRTGLKGAFDIELAWKPDTAIVAATGPDAPSLFTALQEQLGLKLDARRGPVEFLVVDSVDRPTEN